MEFSLNLSSQESIELSHNTSQDLVEESIYYHEGFDKLCVHSCLIYDLGITITSVDCFTNELDSNNLQHYIIIADNDILKLIDTKKQEIKSLKGHRSSILSVICDENRVISMSRDGGINIWDPWDSSGLEWKNSLTGSRYNLTSLAVSDKEDGVLLATTKDGYLCAWNRTTHLPIHTSQVDLKGLYCSAICDSNNLLLVGGFGRLHIHDENFHSFSHVTTLGGHTGPILAVRAANGYVATGGEDKSIIVHDLNTFHQVFVRRNAHASAVTSLLHYSESCPHFSTNQLTYLISGGRDAFIHIMAFPTLELLFSIAGHEGRVTSLTLTPSFHQFQNRPALISCSSDNTLKVWKIYRSFNWERRKYFMMLLVQCGYIRLQLFRAVNASLDKDAADDSNFANLKREVFGKKGILRSIMAFI